MEAECSLSHSQEPYPEPDQFSAFPHPTSWRSTLILSSHLRLGLPSGLCRSGFLTKTLYSKSNTNFYFKKSRGKDHSRESVNLPKTDKETEVDKYQTLRALRDAFFLCEVGGGLYLLDLAKTKRVKKWRARQYEETLLCRGWGRVGWGRRSITFLEGSQTSPRRPSGSSNMKIKMKM